MGIRPWVWGLIGLLALAAGASGVVWWEWRQAGSPPESDPNRWDDRPVVSRAAAPRASFGDARIAASEPRNVGFELPQPTSSGSDWPTIFGPTADSISRESGVDLAWPSSGPREKWRRAVGIGYSVPIVAGDTLVLFHRLGDEEIVAGLDAESGTPRWEFQYPTQYRCKFQYSNGPYSTPVVANGRIYAMGAEGKLHCLELATGEAVWRRDLHADYEVEEGLFGAGASPLVSGGRVFVNLGGLQRDAGIIALDAATGETLWTATDHAAGYATPRLATIHGREFLFVLTAEGLVALDPATGHQYWFVEFKSKSIDSVNAVSPLVVGDRVLLVTGPGPGSLCLRILPDGSCREQWRDRRVLDSQWNNLVTLDGCVFGFTSKRAGRAFFRCVDLNNGAMRWEYDSELERGASLAVEGHFILLGENGQLTSLQASATGPPLVRAATVAPILAAPCYTAPALSRGLLYLRNEETLLCLDLRRLTAASSASATGKKPPADQ